jgi:hypothetical protein
MRNPLHLPRVLKDTASALGASLPNAQKAAETNREILELIRELRNPQSGLSDEERAAMRRRIDLLSEQMGREGDAAEHPYEELSARHPDWVDY